jgi:two-component system, chemotaxis family, sensor kinase CheA
MSMDGMEFDDSIIQEFVAESREHLSTIEDDLLRLEREKDHLDPELVNKVFRSIHTIKGGAGFLGLVRINELSHTMETILSMVRSNQLKPGSRIVDTLLGGADVLKLMIEDIRTSNETDISIVMESLSLLLNQELPGDVKRELQTDLPLVDTQGNSSELTINAFSARHLNAENKNLFALRFDFRVLMKKSQKGLLGIIRRLLDQGQIIDGKLDIPLDDLHAGLPAGPLLYVVLFSTGLEAREIRKMTGLVAVHRLQVRQDETITELDRHNIAEHSFALLTEDGSQTGVTEFKKLGDILMEWGDMTREDVDQILSLQGQRFGELAVEAGFVTEEKIQAALAEQEQVRKTGERREQQSVEAVASIRVPAVKVDSLVNLAGELVTFQARLSQIASQKNDAEIKTLAKGGERLIWSLRDHAMSIRMLPIGTTFSKFNRVVRDLSHDLGKEVELTTCGADTELDKTVIEKLADPMVHLIRNCVDHGIEMPKDRLAAGKPAKGVIHLTAEHSGAFVLISIADDGAGLDVAAIRKKALEKGLLQPHMDPSDKEIFNFIFAAGFSTAKKVTSVSGRGVGMDVVKKNVESLRGSIDIQSRFGHGTTITLKLPLTLAIIDGLLVKIQGEFFVLPLSQVERCVELRGSEHRQAAGRHITTVRGEMVPYIALQELFNIAGSPPEIEQIVIVEVEDRRIGMVVDRVIGEYQTVIKPLGSAYKDVDKISGATILGDGTVALILDVQRIAMFVEHAENDQYRQLEKRNLHVRRERA